MIQVVDYQSELYGISQTLEWGGDVLDYGFGRSVNVVWNKGRFVIEFSDKSLNGLYPYWNLKIIGNIYERVQE